MDEKPAKCSHVRVQSIALEEVVWTEVKRHLENGAMAKMIVDEAHEIEKKDAKNNESAILRQKLTHMKRKLESLAERLTELPKDVSPEPVFDLMRKTETESKALTARIGELGTTAGARVLPVEMHSYLALMNALGKLDQSDPEIKTKIFECLIHKVEITKDGCKIHFFAGESEIERGLASAGPAPSFIGAEAGLNNLRSLGSRVLTNGGP